MVNSRCAVANLPANRSKNRLVNMVPYDSARVLLEEIPGVDGSDYINASWIDGYRSDESLRCYNYVSSCVPTFLFFLCRFFHFVYFWMIFCCLDSAMRILPRRAQCLTQLMTSGG